MIEFVIPTYKRIDRQRTIYSIPEGLRDNITAVVQAQEAEAFKAAHPWVKVWVLPEGTRGIALTRKLIAQNWKGKRYMVMDDDLEFHVLFNGPEKLQGRDCTPEDFNRMLDEVEGYMDAGIVHGGFRVNGIHPGEKPFEPLKNTRIERAVWMSDKFPADDVEWLAPPEYEIYPEDFYVNLQLLLKGYENRVLNWFRTDGSASQAAGGCSEYRTIENHNTGTRWLASMFPDFITVRSKTTKTGPWAGKEKLAMTIQWNQAYKWGEKNRQSDLFKESI